MRWRGRDGRPLPLDRFFAAHLLGVQRRAGLAVSRIVQTRARRRGVEETSVLLVRTAAGTRTMEGEGCDR